ncbi:MAG: response regulator transcription factor [Phycisphaerae bacterium]
MNAIGSVLIVEDEADMAYLLQHNLEREGYRCQWVANGVDGLAVARRNPPDLLILDRMLPSLSGDQVLSRLRRDPNTSNIPVLMLTAKAEESDELAGFTLGADDYVTKPFSMKLLLARIDALLRRTATFSPTPDVLKAGPISLNQDRREVTLDGKIITLTATEFGILWELMVARGRVLSRGQLIDAVLGVSAVVTDRTIDVHVAAMRKKIGRAASIVQTIRGVGYALRQVPEEEV